MFCREVPPRHSDVFAFLAGKEAAAAVPPRGFGLEANSVGPTILVKNFLTHVSEGRVINVLCFF